MKRALCPMLAWALIGSLAVPVLGQEKAPSGPLSMIPAEAVGFICVRNLKQADERLGEMIQELGLGPMLQIHSLVMALREYGPMGDGLDENGALAMVMLGAETPDQLMTNAGLIVSATDPQALLESMNPQPSEEGTSRVELFGRPSFAKPKKQALVIASTPAAAKALSQDGPGIDTKLKASEREAMADLDLVAWVDATTALKTFKPMIDEFFSAIKATSGGEEGSFQAIQMQEATEALDMFFEGAETMFMGLSLGKGGLGLRFALTLKAGSELARLSSVQQVTSQSLLVGLPQENFIFACGQAITAEQAAEGVKHWAKYLQAKEITEALGAEKAEQLTEQVTEWYGMVRGGAFAVASLPPGPEGLIGLSLVCKVTDAPRWTDMLKSMVDLVKGIKTEDEQVGALLEAITYQADGATVGGVSVAEMSLDPSRLEDIEPEWIDQMKKIVGKDGLLIRVGAVDDRHVVLAFGGGEARLGELIAQAKAGKAPLSNDPGIKRVAEKLPKAKTSEGYLALDRVVGLIKNVTEVMGEAFPITMAEVNAPIAFAGSGDKTMARLELYIPMELVVETKNTVMQQVLGMMAGGMQPGMAGGTDEEMIEAEEDTVEEQGTKKN